MYRYCGRNLVNRLLNTDIVSIRVIFFRSLVTNDPAKLRDWKVPKKFTYSLKDGGKSAGKKSSSYQNWKLTKLKISEKNASNGNSNNSNKKILEIIKPMEMPSSHIKNSENILEIIKPLEFKKVETSQTVENIGVELVGKIEKS